MSTEFTAHYLRDAWVVPHIIGPLVFTILTRSAWAGFILSGFGELFAEYTLYAIFGQFLTFIGDPGDVENLTQSYVEDWLIHGGMGVLFGWIYYKTFDYIAPIRWSDPLIFRLLYRVFMYGIFIVALPSALYSIRVNGFELGVTLYPLIQLIGVYFLGHWLWWPLSAILAFQIQFDWLLSSAVQSWVCWALYTGALTVYGTWRWTWYKRIHISPVFVH